MQIKLENFNSDTWITFFFFKKKTSMSLTESTFIQRRDRSCMETREQSDGYCEAPKIPLKCHFGSNSTPYLPSQRRPDRSYRHGLMREEECGHRRRGSLAPSQSVYPEPALPVHRQWWRRSAVKSDEHRSPSSQPRGNGRGREQSRPPRRWAELWCTGRRTNAWLPYGCRFYSS